MGKKTDKKVKSDRVNVLRKQYDTFLEEDKKRKDRNDYILGRLDNMRYSSTAVQLRHTPTTYGDYLPTSYNRHSHRPESVQRNDMQMVHMNQQMTRPGYHNMQLDVPRNYIEETSILKEISKKYILIPKLRTNIPNDIPEVIPPAVPAPVSSVIGNITTDHIDNNDWKSKYDILEQLKTEEKGEGINKYPNKDEQFNNKATRKYDLDRANDNDHPMVYKRDDLPTRYEEEIPEKDLSDQLVAEKSLEKCTISEKIEQIPSSYAGNATSAHSLTPVNAAPYIDPPQKEVYYQHNEAFAVNEKVEHDTQPVQYDIPAEQNVEAVSKIDSNVEYQNYPEQEYPIEYDQFIPGTDADANHTEFEQTINQEENYHSPIEVTNPNEIVDEIHKENIVQEPILPENEYLTEIADTQEFRQDEYPTEIVNTQEVTPDEAVVLQDDGLGTNPENYMTDDGTIVEGTPVPQMLAENPPDNSGIEEFDAEQREMFYSEQADKNYEYDEQDAAAGDAYNKDYSQSQNYPETQEYAYYENAAQAEEETYPVEINEHEETQQLYDQQYEQQYTTNYEQGYEQQEVYIEQDPTQPQFQQPALYDQAQKEFEQHTYGQQPTEETTQEEVEHVLDREDGYIEKNVEAPADPQITDT